MGGLVSEIDQFMGIILQVVQKLPVGMINIADIFKILIAHPFERRDPMSDRKMFVKCFRAPVGRFVPGNNGLQTTSLVARRDFHIRPIEECRGEIQI